MVVRRAPICEINMIPYIDVMLVLLVICIACIPVLQQQVAQLELPKVDYAAQQSPPPSERVMSVLVDAAKRHYVQLGEGRPEEGPLTRAELIDRLTTYAEQGQWKKSELYVQIKGEASLSYQRIVDVLSALHRADFSQVALVTEEDWQQMAG